MIKEIANNYRKYSLSMGWTQQEAANKVDCSVQHINRIFNDKCLPSAKLAAKMEEVMGKPKDSSLEECMKRYPIGHMILDLFDGIDNGLSPSVFDESNKDYHNILEWCKSEPFYEVNHLIHDTPCSYYYNILYYVKGYGFMVQDFSLTKITGYYTNNGYTFKPYIKYSDGTIYNYEETMESKSKYSVSTLILPDFSNLKEVIIKVFDTYNAVNKLQCVPCFCEEDYIKALNDDKE